MISFVLPKGRLLDKSLKFLREIGISFEHPKNRELIIKNGSYELLLAKAFDVPVYVEHGMDMGIVGRDVIEEHNFEGTIPLKLPFGKCRLSLAIPREKDVEIDKMEGYRIATKYPRITERFFESHGIEVETIKLHGSIELAPKVGIADAIVDIVDTGKTLRENGLKEIEKIMDISAVLLVNRISQKVKFEKLNVLIFRMREVIKNGY